MSYIDSSQIVYINSRDRTSGTDSNFTFNLGLVNGSNYDRVTLLQCTIPKSYYSVITGHNYFTLTEGIDEVVIYMTPGNYNRNSFALSLKSSLNTYSPNNWTYNVTYPNASTDVDTGKYTYTVSGNSSQPEFTFDTVTFIDELMGFIQSETEVLNYPFTADTLVSDTVINMQPYQCVQIHSSVVKTKGQGKNTNILQTIIANSGNSSYSNISYLCPDIDSFSHELIDNTNLASFYLTDEDNIPLDLNNINFQMSIIFWKKNTSLFNLSSFLTKISNILF